MSKLLTAIAGVAVLTGILLAPAAAQEQGLGERLGERIDRGIRQLSSELQEEWAEVRGAVERMSVQARVYSRLHWDKALATSEIDIEVREGDVIVLMGRVPSAAAKQKAVELAQDTVGAQGVIDQLSVATTTAE